MNNQIGVIEGEDEDIDYKTQEIIHLQQELYISTFMGRIERGFSVQLAINNVRIQLNKEEVLHLIKILSQIY